MFAAYISGAGSKATSADTPEYTTSWPSQSTDPRVAAKVTPAGVWPGGLDTHARPAGWVWMAAPANAASTSVWSASHGSIPPLRAGVPPTTLWAAHTNPSPDEPRVAVLLPSKEAPPVIPTHPPHANSPPP